MKLSNIYLEEERYNPRVRATIPAVWVAEFECGSTLPICSKYEASNDAQAKAILLQRTDIKL